MTVALVTAQAARNLDEDLPLLSAALARRGVEAEVVVWDDPAVEWRRFARIVVRSTWDYTVRRGKFLSWAGRAAAAAALHNPLPLLRWSTDKRYLADLAAAGVAIVPTVFCAPGQPASFPDGAFVIKPSIGAGSVGAARFAADGHAAAREHLARLHDARQVALIQPYLAEIDRRGETALIYFGGSFSHAVRKAAILSGDLRMVGDLFAAEQIVPTVPTAAERALADAALAVVPRRTPALYARVDLVPGDDGAPRLLELELCEPSLFLAHEPGAADRLAAAIMALK